MFHSLCFVFSLFNRKLIVVGAGESMPVPDALPVMASPSLLKFFDCLGFNTSANVGDSCAHI